MPQSLSDGHSFAQSIPVHCVSDWRGCLLTKASTPPRWPNSSAPAKRPGPRSMSGRSRRLFSASSECTSGRLSSIPAWSDDEPRNSELWMSYGNALKTVGRTDDAIAAMRRALAAQPSLGEAYWSLANFKSFTFTDRDLATMRKQLSGKIDQRSAIHLHFALGKALEERKEHEASFRHYDAGNRITASQLSPDQMTIAPRVDAAISTFDDELLGGREAAGMPGRRSDLHRSAAAFRVRHWSNKFSQATPRIEGTIGANPALRTDLAQCRRNEGRAVRRPIPRNPTPWQCRTCALLGEEYLSRARTRSD